MREPGSGNLDGEAGIRNGQAQPEDAWPRVAGFEDRGR